MAMTGVRDGFELDDHGILRDSFASDFHVDEHGILHDDLDLFKHGISTGGQGTDSGISGDKPSSTTSTLRQLHASFDEDLAPIGDESINISDFEASRDDLDSIEGDQDGDKKSRSYRSGAKGSETPEGDLERDNQRQPKSDIEGKGQDLFSEEYYKQLRELGVLVDGADFSRDESQTELDVLEAQLSHDHVEYSEDNRDLIGEYLQDQYSQAQRGGEERKKSGNRYGERYDSHVGQNSQGRSLPSVSGQSLSEFASDDTDMMYTESPQIGDDDEIFLINHQLLPASADIQAEKLPVTPSDHGSRPSSMADRARSPRSGNKQYRYHSKQSPSPSDGFHVRSGASTPHKSRPDSAVSFASATSESVRPHSGTSTPGKSSMSKARSQESFFEHGRQQGKSGEKLPKRMLPTPSTGEGSQSQHVRNKSKSVSNIANRSAPLKPTHMTISEITRITMDEAGDAPAGLPISGGDGTLDRSEGELTTKLKQESTKRIQATELVQQLQKEYDSLLSKYALAELTIDQMRLGARITLHADSPTPSSIQSGMISPSMGAHKAQMLQLPTPSAQRASAGSFSAVTDGQSHASTQAQTTDPRSRSLSSSVEKTLISVRNSLDAGGQGSLAEAEDRTSMKTPGSAETVKLTIQTQTTSLNDRLDQFHTLMENRQLTLEEQEKAFENIRTDHEKLRRSYLQAKEDYKVLRRSGATLPDTDFDNNKELEGQLFRLGMKFDEVHETVDSNLKQQVTRRQPFQSSRLAQDQADDEGVDDVDQGSGQDGDQGNESVEAELEKRAEQLHEEYRGLMDRYRRLKQMVPTPELDKETDNLVRKLKVICVEMPDMFRLSPEVQERWEKLQRRDQRRSPLPQSREDGAVGGSSHREHNGRSSVLSSPKVRGTPTMGDHSISSYPSHRHDGRSSRMDDSFSRTPSSLSGSRSSLMSPRDPNSSTVAQRSSATPSPSPRGRERGGSPGSLDGAAAPRTRESYDARINRPRRHKHDFRDPKSSKMAERGSYSSLADSGLSDNEGGRDRPHDDALANLPGPGKMKQLTHQRGDNDMDSGFVGSVVSTEGAQPPLPGRPPEPTLRLRPPTDRNQDRSRRDSSASSSTMASVRSRESGSERRSRHAKPPAAATSPSTRVGQHSIDRSYDGELDESISQARDQDPRLKGARPKEPTSRTKAASKTDIKGEKPGEKKEEVMLSHSQSSRSMRSQSDSAQDDETLEDISDGDMTDVSTPRLIKQQGNKSSVKTSTQQTQSSPPRPPSSQGATTPRPPTPYHLEGEKVEAETSRAEIPPLELTRTRSERPPDDETVQKKSQEQQQKESPKPQAPTATQQNLQRPESRGEPTTDLYHTRPRRERKRERSRDAESVASVESSRPGSRRGRRGSDISLRARGEDRGVGSDVEVGSDLTRVSSVHSARLRAMQDEIEKLKLGVQQAYNKASEQPELPPPLPPPQQPEGPEYYDPFDDPYGFMRMPRRRANSFSGGRVREFDEWYWTLPNERRNMDEDIPLGYAAADAYNLHYREKTPEAARQRLRRRGDRRRHGEEAPPNMVDPRAAVQEGMVVGAGPSLQTATTTPTAAAAPPPPPNTLTPGAPAQVRQSHGSNLQARYNYYVPPGGGRQPEAASRNPNFNPYRQHTTPLSVSQPNLSGTLAGVEPSYPSHQTQQQTQPWYTIRRTQWAPPTASQGHYAQGQGYQPYGSSYQQPTAFPSNSYYYSSYPSSGSTTPVQNGSSYWTDLCPLCGGSGAHYHEEDGQLASGYAVNGYQAEGRSRRRSRSLSRSRHYLPKRGSSRRRYNVREFTETDSEESDQWEIVRGPRRSGSLSRRRSRSHSSPRHSSRRRHRRHRRNRERLGAHVDLDLDESLLLSEDISRLTKRMLGNVRGELKRHSDSKEFGSSYW